ncbi:MAG: response regulator [Myxococcota bacterium]|nr:response regulator [Myxococcota bacterium]
MPKTLLLADDSVTIQKVVGISFASEDIELVTVDNGDDAVAKAREVRPDIVLADVVMPGMNGYEVCEAIKSDPQLRHVPVLLLTGTFEAFDEGQADEAGADGHITKPFEAQSLVDLVNARLADAPAPPPAPEPALAADSTLDPVTPAPVEAPEALTTLEPVPVGEAAPEPPAFDFAAGAETQIPSEPAPAPVVEVNPTPSEEPEALTTAMLVDADDDEAARTQLAFAPEPAAETFVAFQEDGAADLFGAAPGTEAAPSPSTDLLVTPEPSSPSEAASDASSDLFAETGATFAAAEDDGEDPLAGALAEPADQAPAAHAADPDPGRDYDVSVSDLGTPLVPLAASDPLTADPVDPAEPAEPGDPADASPFESDADDVASPFEAAPVDAGLPSMDTGEPVFAGEAPAEDSPFAGQAGISEPGEPVFSGEAVAEEPVFAGEAAAEEPVFSGEAEVPEPVFSGETEAAEPVFSGEALAEPIVASAGASGEALPMDDEELRGRLHETLERMAWDAFGDVTERIVSEAVERIEKVAWEVIPQMAETLIREEIKRMKGDD